MVWARRSDSRRALRAATGTLLVIAALFAGSCAPGPQGGQVKDASSTQRTHIIWIYPAHDTELYARPGGALRAHLAVATPLKLLAVSGKWSSVLLTAWVQAGSDKTLYMDTGGAGSAIECGSGVAPLPRATETKAVGEAGVIWRRVILTGDVRTADMVLSQSVLWTRAAAIYRTTCSACHALHAPAEYTAEDWLEKLQEMESNVGLSGAQIDLLLSYLQWHASDMIHPHRRAAG